MERWLMILKVIHALAVNLSMYQDALQSSRDILSFCCKHMLLDGCATPSPACHHGALVDDPQGETRLGSEPQYVRRCFRNIMKQYQYDPAA